MKQKILIFGAGGMLGRAIAKVFEAKYKVIPLTHKDCDITDKKSVFLQFEKYKPVAAVNAAAYCDVDGCELDKRKAFSVNAKGPGNIAQGCKKFGAFLIHISTDYVFSGRKKSAYNEADQAGPLSIYGESKLRGEFEICRTLKNYIIIRTCWLFGEGRRNFASDILERAKKTKELSIVNDKFSSPTYVLDLARGIFGLFTGVLKDRGCCGVYHISNSGYCSWYDYAKAVLKFGNIRGVKVRPIKMRDIKFRARRPRYSSLNNFKFNSLTKAPLRPWQEAVKEYIDEHQGRIREKN